jgi:hypothetical protein
MIRNFSEILGAAAFALAVAICLLAGIGPSKAQDFTLDQRTSCSANAVGCKAVFPK